MRPSPRSAPVRRRRTIPLAGTIALLACWTPSPFDPARAHGGAHADAASDDTAPGGAVGGGAVGGAPPAAPDAPRRTATAPAAPPHEIGVWSEPEDWPVLAVHAALLPTGEVLAWDATPDDFDDDPHTAESRTTRVTLWDPATGSHRPVWNDTGADLFCAGSAHLWDGRVLFAGGDSGRAGRNGPLADSHVFDPWTRTWSETDSLVAPRWYSSVAALSDGRMLTFGGTYSPRPLAETFGLNGRWSPLPVTVPFTVSGDYAWLQASSDGDVAYLGPDASLGVLSTEGDGAWSSLGTRDADGYRSYGSYALFDVDRALVSGGGDSLASATVVDLAHGTSTPTAPMRRGRRQHDLTILADGRVLASGGNASGARFVDLEAGVRTAEVWDPATGEWSDVAALPSERQYHSTTLLLPDGRVLSAGGGYCSDCGDVGYHAQSAEIWSPPYLFEPVPDGGVDAADDAPDRRSRPAARPRIDGAPERIDWGAPFTLGSPDAHAVRRVHLIKLGSVTHSQNQDQRLVPLRFRSDGDRLVVQAPESRHVAPPGHYLLFAVDGRGVPSTGAMVRVGQPLLRPGEVLADTLGTGPEAHEVRGEGEHRLRVRLQGDADVLALRATVRGTDGTRSDAPLSCAAARGPTGGTLCTASAPGDTRWLLGVDGPDGAAYSLLVEIEAGETDAPTPGFGAAGGPAPPRGARATASTPDSVTLSWDAPTGAPADAPPVSGYEIHRDGRLLRFQRETGLHQTSLRPATTYVYRIVAVDGRGNRSAPSEAIVASTPPFEGPDPDERYHPETPSAPGHPRVIAYSRTAAELFWEPSWDDGRVVGYEVSRDGVATATLDATSWYDDSLVPGIPHAYTVVALDDDGRRSVPSPTAVLAPVADGTRRLPQAAAPHDSPAPAQGDSVASSGVPAPGPDAAGGSASWALLALALGALRRRRTTPGPASPGIVETVPRRMRGAELAHS